MLELPDPIAIRPNEAARRLGVSRSRVFEEITTGRLPSTKVGRARLIPVSALDEWLDQHIAEDMQKRA